MSGQRHIQQKTLRLQIAEEAIAFGTAGASAVELQPHDGANPILKQENIKPQDSRAYLWADQPLSVAGLKSAEIELEQTLRTHATVLDATASPAESPLGTLLAVVMGGVSSGAGAVVDTSGSTTTSIKCATLTHAARFVKGTWLGAVVSGVRYFRKVTASDGTAGTITVAPPLPGAPTAGSAVWNSRTYYPSQHNTRSLTVNVARDDGADQAAQFQLLGCNGDLSLSMEPNKLVTLKTKLMGATWRGPDATLALLPAPAYSEPHGPGFLMGHTEVWLTKSSDFTASGAVHVPTSKVTPAFPGEAKRFLADVGGIEGKAGIVRAVPDEGAYSTVELATTAFDPAWCTSFDAGEVWCLTVLHYSGSGSTRRAQIFHWPGLEFAERPTNELADKGLVNKLQFRTVGEQVLSRAGLEELLLSSFQLSHV